MPPLVALVLFGFLFLVALCLTVWSALTLGDRTRRYESNSSRSSAGAGRVAYVPMTPTQQPVWRSGGQHSSGPVHSGGLQPRSGTPASGSVQPRASAAPDEPARSTVSNDDFRGARAVVTPRPVTEDAFERFLENENNGRR